ncbi:MAG: hypothetical protein A2189_01840 [Paenibacillus sp. RIFOXYA1_FULL_44_5]|nr:MAG: hypothetical protein A2189_01840 [Paenibacillus sp. RIFOXYA1_FULL_44_5]
MRVPDFARYRSWLSGIGLFVSGIIVGSALFMAVSQHNFNILYVKYLDLQKQKQDLEIENQTLNKYKKKQTVISRIEVHIEPQKGDKPLDEVIAQEIEKKVQQELDFYIGKQTADLSTPEQQTIMKQMINRRYFIHNVDYQIKVNTIVILYSHLNLWIEAKEFTKQSFGNTIP